MCHTSRRKDDDMVIAKVQVSKTTCKTTPLVPIPKGIVGAAVSIEYTDPAWDGLQKTVVFRSAVTKDVLDAGNEVIVPAEVVSRAGIYLYMGVYGVDAANNVVIPTIWTELGMIHGAAAPSGDASSDPSLPVWAQIQAAMGNLDDLDTDAKSNLVAAINEALTKGGGEADPATVQKIVDDYLKANPPGAGADGKDGITPTIGENGNWYLGDTDTGKPSRGAAGAKGDKGDTGATGAQGKPGERGPQGETGPQGPQGETGPAGATGAAGAEGADGVTPHIGSNKHWFIGTQDTGVVAEGQDGAAGAKGDTGPTGPEGPKGATGPQGPQGPAGKTPVKGTDYFTQADKQEIAEDAAALVNLSGKQNKITASGILKGDGAGGVEAATPGTDYLAEAPVTSVNGAGGEAKSTFYVTVTRQGDGTLATADKTAEEVHAAYAAGYAVYAIFTTADYPYILPLTTSIKFLNTIMLAFATVGSMQPESEMTQAMVTYDGSKGKWFAWLGALARSNDIPTALKNPNALTIKIGSTPVTYDGSEAKTVEIADGSEVSY